MKNEQNVNKFIVKGKITYKKENENYVLIQVYTKVGKYANFPSMFFFGENMEKLRSFNKGDAVEITGKVESYRNKNANDNKKYLQSMVGIDVKPVDPNEIELTTHTYENAAQFTGEVQFISEPSNNTAIALINTKERNRILVTSHGKTKETFANLKAGDNVSVLCNIQTLVGKDGRKKNDIFVVKSFVLNE